MAATKNTVRGERHYRAKLTEEDVRLILELKAERDRLIAEAKKITTKRLADKFGVHEKTVQRVFYRGGWAHV